ncbi:MAG: hypothetical protein RLZZ161_823 [Bacteroidota bacterium]|jgi:hypothetical protein
MTARSGQIFSLFWAIAIFAQNHQMIQRIQSVYLLLAALAATAVFKLPFASVIQAENQSVLFNDGTFGVYDNVALQAVFAAVIIMAVLCILSYKNRKFQIKLSMWGALTSVLSIVLLIAFFTQDHWAMANTQHIKDDFGLGMPVFSFLFFLLARYNIVKDEKKVQSMDRLR